MYPWLHTVLAASRDKPVALTLLIIINILKNKTLGVVLYLPYVAQHEVERFNRMQLMILLKVG